MTLIYSITYEPSVISDILRVLRGKTAISLFPLRYLYFWGILRKPLLRSFGLEGIRVAQCAQSAFDVRSAAIFAILSGEPQDLAHSQALALAEVKHRVGAWLMPGYGPAAK